MNTVTLAIPQRCQDGVAEIKRYVEESGKLWGMSFSVILTGELDPNAVYIVKDTLNPDERRTCENAINAFNNHLSANFSDDAWQASAGATEDERAFLKKFGAEFDKLFPPKTRTSKRRGS